MQTLLSLFRTSNHIVSLSLADLTDEVARRRNRGDQGPSIAWTVGHMLDSRHKVIAFLGDTRVNAWATSFDSTAATDGATYPAITVLRAEWQQMHETLEQAFANAAPDALEQPIPNAGVHGESTIRDKVVFIAWHEAYHIGVIGASRTAAGLPGPADLARSAALAS